MSKKNIANMNEKQKRLALGKEAARMGFGGIQKVSQKYHVSRGTVAKGMKEHEAGVRFREGDRIRKPGGGRKKFADQHPEIVEEIVEMTKEKNANLLSDRLIARRVMEAHPGVHICSNTVGRILRESGVRTRRKSSVTASKRGKRSR